MNRSFTILIATLLGWLLATTGLRAQGVPAADEGGDGPEEISVQYTVPDIGAIYVPAMLRGTTLYLPVTEIFAYLHVKMDSGSGESVINGFMPGDHGTYSINASAGSVRVGDQQYPLAPDDAVMSEGRLFLRADLFGAFFGLHNAFDFRSLEVRLHADFDLPAIRELQRERAHRSLHRLPDTPPSGRRVRGSWQVFSPGVAEWSVAPGITPTGLEHLSYNLGIGGQLLGGAFESRISGTMDSLPRLADIPWRWSYVDNDATVVRQVLAGNLSTRLPNAIHGTTRGIALTNRSTDQPTVFSRHIIDDYTEPGWTVEVHANGRLVDYAVTDETGHYHFELPLHYGATGISLRFFGPWGEERELERTVRIPHTLIPVGSVEYQAEGGLLNDGNVNGEKVFGRGEVLAGLTESLTLGGGTYAFTGMQVATLQPYLTGSWRAFDWFIVSGNYSPTLGADATASLALTRSVSLEFSGTDHLRSVDGSVAGRLRLVSASISAPLDFPGLSGSFRGRVTEQFTPEGRDVQAQGSLGFWVLGLPFTIAGDGNWSGSDSLTLGSLRTAIRTSVRLFGGLGVRPTLEYNWTTRRLTSVGLDVDQAIMSGVHLDLSLTRDMINGNTTGHLGLQLDLSVARATVRGAEDGGHPRVDIAASGALYFDEASASVIATDRSSLQRASLAVRPFLDLNNNDRFDAGEPLVPDVDVMVDGGLVRRGSDTLVRVLDLEPNHEYAMSIDDAHVPNISWRAKFHAWNVSVPANHVQLIDVPMTVSGEVSGTLRRLRAQKKEGLAGVIIRFERRDTVLDDDDGGRERGGGPRVVYVTADSTVTMDGGDFYMLGLAPGHYRAVVDEDRMLAMGLRQDAAPIEFDIRPGTEGDSVEGLELLVK